LYTELLTTISVHQMLSEKHTTEFIEFWLRHWQRSGAPKPKEVVCDFSRALLCDICLAFNNQTIKSYVDDSFNLLSRLIEVRKRSYTVIRIDVAHFIAAACRWNCWKLVRQICIKEFFIRCIALMIECVLFSEFQKIFYLTCVVALQIHQDVEIDYLDVQTAKDARKNLEEEIAGRDIKDFEVNSVNNEPEHLKVMTDDEYNKFDQNSNTKINDWVDVQVRRAKKIQRAGEELNPFYLPEFIDMLSVRAKEFSLWTNVGMDYNISHATSSYMEGYFNAGLATRAPTEHARRRTCPLFATSSRLSFLAPRFFLSPPYSALPMILGLRSGKALLALLSHHFILVLRLMKDKDRMTQ